jgi:hypothetical protein
MAIDGINAAAPGAPVDRRQKSQSTQGVSANGG